MTNNQVPHEKPKNKPKNTLPTGERYPLHNETLMEIFNFSAATLNMNRNGMASNLQKDDLKGDLKNDADAMWLMLMIMLGAALVVGIIMALRGIPMEYLAIGAGIAILPILWIGYRQQIGKRKDVDKLRIKTVTGQAQIIWTPRGTSMIPMLRVDNVLLEISLYEAQALEQFDIPQLRVYYAEHSKQLLSAEIITTTPDTKNKLSVDDLLDDNADELIAVGRKYDERQE
jgi:archaeosine-15-forming tRNA-guanine transglycosylase